MDRKQFLKLFPNAEVRYKGGGCFPGGVKVLTASNEWKSIEEIKEGEKVYCVSPCGWKIKGTVVKKHKHAPSEYVDKIYKLYLSSGKEILITDNHWVFFKNSDEPCKKTHYFTEVKELVKFKDVFVFDDKLRPVKIERYEILDERPTVYNLTVLPYDNFIVDGLLVHNKGKGKGGKAEVVYHDIFAIGEVQIWEDPTIIFEARLGNCLLIGDGTTNEAYLPNFYMKKFVFSRGWGYVKFYPKTIKLYKNSIENEMQEGVDYEYDSAIGKVTFAVPPANLDIICFTATYDNEHPNNTTFYADFTFAEILKRVGLRYYKHEDQSIDNYLKACAVSKNLINEVWKPVMTGSMDIVYNPFVEIGHTIYVKNEKTGFENNVFVKGISKTISNDNVSSVVDVYTFPEVPVQRKEEEKELYRFLTPDVWVMFLENDSCDSYWGDGIYLRGLITDAYQRLKFGFKDVLKLKLKMANKTAEYPTTINFIDNNDIYVKYGTFNQFYSGNFKLSLWNSNEFESEFPSLHSGEKVFEDKSMDLEIVNETTQTNISSASIVKVAKYPMFKGYFAPILPLPAFVTHHRNADHILFLDSNKDLWLIDMFLNSEKIKNLDFVDENTVCMVSDRRNKVFFLTEHATHLVVYDIENDTTDDIFINDCICGSLITNPLGLVSSVHGNPVIYGRANAYKYEYPSLSYQSYFNFMEIKSNNDVIKYRVLFEDDGFSVSGFPMIYKGQFFFGGYAFDIKKITSEFDNPSSWTTITAENSRVDFVNIALGDNLLSNPYISDNMEQLATDSGFNIDFVKTCFTVNIDRNKIYTIMTDSSNMNAEQLMDPFICGSSFAVGERIDNEFFSSDNKWNKIAKFVSSDPTDKDSFKIFPLYVYSDRMVCMVMGNEIKRKINKDLKWALGVIDLTNKELRIVVGKFSGQDIGTYSQLTLELLTSIWFKDKVLLNWKNYENIIEYYWNDSIGIIQGE